MPSGYKTPQETKDEIKRRLLAGERIRDVAKELHVSKHTAALISSQVREKKKANPGIPLWMWEDWERTRVKVLEGLRR